MVVVKVNIIIINDYGFINGGAAKVAIDSAVGLSKKGYDVQFFTAVGPPEPVLIKNNINVTCLSQYDILNDPIRLRAVTQGIWNVKAAQVMAALLNRYSPSNTVVHVHGWTKALSSSPIKMALKHGYKVVLTLHDYFSACPNGGFFDHPENTVCKRIPLSSSCVKYNCDVRNYPQKLWRVSRQIVQQYRGDVPSGVSGFIAVSDFSLSILRDYLPAEALVKVIPNPVHMGQGDPVPVEKNENFIFAGRLSSEKGGFLFAEAVQKSNVNGVIVGDGPQAAAIKSKYPNLRYTGWLTSSEVRHNLKDAYALVFPSLWYEAQPLTVLEALSMGIPVIVSDTTAAREFVVDGETGLWFDGGNVIELSKKMIGLRDNKKLAKQLGHSAYERFWQNPFTVERYIESLKHFYEEILELE